MSPRRWREHNFGAHQTEAQNQSLRYATHQLITPIGIVATSAHHNGNAKSATTPKTVKAVQNTFRCIPPF